MKKILVFGVFDGIHEGHFSFLRQARECGDILIAAVTRGGVVERLKGRKPRKDQGLRIKELLETGLVDEAVEGDAELEKWEVIGKVGPDVVALGYDQESLGAALRQYVEVKGLDIEICVMKPYMPNVYHSSILRSVKLKAKNGKLQRKM